MQYKLMLKGLLMVTVGVLVGLPKVSAECTLSQCNIQQTEGIFYYELAGKKTLLRERTVPNGATVYHVCGNGSPIKLTCNKNGIQESVACDERVKANVIENQDSSCPKQFKSYSIGYQIQADFLELYRVCFNGSSSKSPIFVTSQLYRDTLDTPRPEQDFTLDRIITGAEAAAYAPDNVTEIFSNFGLPCKRIDRGHLAAAADFMFLSHKRATFKYVNVVPQFDAINTGNWKSIESWIRTDLRSDDQLIGNRKRPRDPSPYYTMITGVLNVLELPNLLSSTTTSSTTASTTTEYGPVISYPGGPSKPIFDPAPPEAPLATPIPTIPTTRNPFPFPGPWRPPIFLRSGYSSNGSLEKVYLNNNLFPVPKWMYKIISNNNACTVFITYNNVFDKPIPSIEEVCTVIEKCPLNDLKSDIRLGKTFCCNVKNFQQINNLNFNICN